VSSARHRRAGKTACTPAAIVTVLVAGGLLSGCGSVGDTLAQRSLSVIFEDGRTQADVARVREKCDGVGGAEALSAGPDNPANRRYPLRFDVSGLDRRSRAELVGCLDGDPSVRGFRDSESTRG